MTPRPATEGQWRTRGIDLARSQHPNLILVDVMMPAVNGFDIVEALRADDQTRVIPIVVLTSRVLTESDKRILNGHVAGIFKRDSYSDAEVIAWLRGIVSKMGAGPV